MNNIIKLGNKLITANESAIQFYISEISKSKYNTISDAYPDNPEKERELVKDAQNGNEEACKELVERNTRFILSIAKQYQNRGIDLAELVSEGSIGFMRAIMKYDTVEFKNRKLISYSVWWVRQSIVMALKEDRMVHIPNNRLSDKDKTDKASKELQQALGRHPDSTEIADYLFSQGTMMDSRFIDSLYVSNHTVSLSKPISDSEGGSLVDILENKEAYLPDGEIRKKNMKEDIEKALNSCLSKKEIIILKRLNGIDQDFEDSIEGIAEEMGYHPERIRQLRKKAIKTLRENKKLKKYLND